MKATSAGYATLQSIYKAKAKEDLAAVSQEVAKICSEVTLNNDGGRVIDQDMIAVFVKNCPFVKVVRGRKMREEYESPNVAHIGRLCRASVHM